MELYTYIFVNSEKEKIGKVRKLSTVKLTEANFLFINGELYLIMRIYITQRYFVANDLHHNCLVFVEKKEIRETRQEYLDLFKKLDD